MARPNTPVANEGINVPDIAYKTAWTALAAALGVLGTYALDLPPAVAPIAIAAINAATAWVRQKLGTTPPPAPPVDRGTWDFSGP